MRKNLLFSGAVATLFGLGLLFSSCEKQMPNPGPDPSPGTTKTEYVIVASEGDANYLLTAPSLDEGSVTVKGNGTEVIGGTYWIFKESDYLFGLAYHKGASGTGGSYFLEADGKPKEKYSYTLSRITTYGFWGDNIVTASTGDSDVKDAEGNFAKHLLFNYLSWVDGSQDNGKKLAENYLGNGEYVSFSGFVEANGKLYTSVVPMGMSRYGVKHFADQVTDQELIAKTDGGAGSGSYTAGMIPSTQYPDRAFVAIYSGNSFDDKPVIAETDKIGFASGRQRSQYYQTIWTADNGDLYVFSPGYGRTFTSSDDLKKVTGTLPSGVVRIKKGATDFDPDYYVNLESLNTKHPMYRCWHITEDYFLLQMYSQGDMSGTKAAINELAIFKGEEKTLIPVTGMPSDLASFGSIPFAENGSIYIPVAVAGEKARPALYKIDPKSGKAVKGLTVESESLITAGKLVRAK